MIVAVNYKNMKLPKEEKNSIEQPVMDQKEDKAQRVIFKVPAQPAMANKQNILAPIQHQDYPLQRFIQVALLFVFFSYFL